jgi:ferrous iron transport protein A
MGERIPLSDMAVDEVGTIVEFLGGWGFRGRLSSMGIRPGMRVTRINPPFGRGPVVIKIGNSQTALGHGMSYKVIVEVER